MKTAIPFWERPCADKGLTSYRHRIRETRDFVMIGARDHEDAMNEAGRSLRSTDRAKLEVWNGERYVPAFPLLQPAAVPA